MSDKNSSNKISLYNRWLNGIEAVGNKLPHPVALFAMLALLIILISAICAALGVSATGELVSDGELKETTVTAVSLLTKDGLAYIFSNAVSNFTSYAPLGMVLVAMLGVGVAEHSGLINALLKRTVQVTPRRLITPVVVFLGVLSNVASDAGYVILIPLGAMVFRAYGRHPMAGLACPAGGAHAAGAVFRRHGPAVWPAGGLGTVLPVPGGVRHHQQLAACAGPPGPQRQLPGPGPGRRGTGPGAGAAGRALFAAVQRTIKTHENRPVHCEVYRAVCCRLYFLL